MRARDYHEAHMRLGSLTPLVLGGGQAEENMAIKLPQLATGLNDAHFGLPLVAVHKQSLSKIHL